MNVSSDSALYVLYVYMCFYISRHVHLNDNFALFMTSHSKSLFFAYLFHDSLVVNIILMFFREMLLTACLQQRLILMNSCGFCGTSVLFQGRLNLTLFEINLFVVL